MIEFINEHISILIHSPHVLSVFGGIFCLLFLAQLIVLILKFYNPKGNFQELDHRIRSWWKICFITLVMLWFGIYGAAFLFMCVSLLAFYEYIKTIGLSKLPLPYLMVAYLTISVQYLLIVLKDYDLFLIFIPLVAQLLLAFIFIVNQRTKDFIKDLGLLQWGLLLTAYSLSHILYFMNLDNPRTLEVEPLGLITFVLVITQANDVFQFLFGKLFGKHKILPRISPNKTVEGLVFGILFSALISYLLGEYLTPLSSLESLGSGIILSVSGFFGDIFMSAIKRDKGVKDFSALLPGHGGILDRVDSLIIAAPIFFHYYRLFFPEFY